MNNGSGGCLTAVQETAVSSKKCDETSPDYATKEFTVPGGIQVGF